MGRTAILAFVTLLLLASASPILCGGTQAQIVLSRETGDQVASFRSLKLNSPIQESRLRELLNGSFNTFEFSSTVPSAFEASLAACTKAVNNTCRLMEAEAKASKIMEDRSCAGTCSEGTAVVIRPKPVPGTGAEETSQSDESRLPAQSPKAATKTRDPR